MVWDATHNPGTTELEAAMLRKLIAELEAAQRWIPLDERLPEMETPVLVVARGYKNRLFVTASMRVWVENCWTWAQMALPYMPDLNDPSVYEFDDDFEYTHWMPMPQPPQQEGE